MNPLSNHPELRDPLLTVLAAQDRPTDGHLAALNELKPTMLARLEAHGLIVTDQRPGRYPEVTDAGFDALAGAGTVHRPVQVVVDPGGRQGPPRRLSSLLRRGAG